MMVFIRVGPRIRCELQSTTCVWSALQISPHIPPIDTDQTGTTI